MQDGDHSEVGKASTCCRYGASEGGVFEQLLCVYMHIHAHRDVHTHTHTHTHMVIFLFT